MPFRLELPATLLDAMVAQARAELPNECCGLLAGLPPDRRGLNPPVAGDGPAPPLVRVVERYPLVNALASPTAFESEDRSLLAAHKDMRRRQLEVIGIYHSHPSSPPVPSKTDLARNYWPGVIHLIISLQFEPPEVRGWWLGETDFLPAEWDKIT